MHQGETIIPQTLKLQGINLIYMDHREKGTRRDGNQEICGNSEDARRVWVYCGFLVTDVRHAWFRDLVNDWDDESWSRQGCDG